MEIQKPIRRRRHHPVIDKGIPSTGLLAPFLYLKDILSRLPTQPNSRIGELLPHRWTLESAA